MSKHIESPEMLELMQLWRAWTAVVDRFAMKRSGRRRKTSPGEYRALHTALLKACRAQTVEAEGPRRALLEEMERIALPWVSVEILNGTKQQILASLLTQCLVVQTELAGRKPSAANDLRRGLIVAAVAAAVMCLVAVGAIFATGDHNVASSDLLGSNHELSYWMDRGHGLFKRAAMAVRWSSFLQKFSVVTVVVVLIGVWWGTQSMSRWS